MGNGHAEAIERSAFIFNVQKYNTYDGPGVRTLVFFKGCPLRCKWCANPEGMKREHQVIMKRDACTGCGECARVCPASIHSVPSNGGMHTVNRDAACIGCRKCEKACLYSAISIVGEQKSMSQLLEIIEEDRAFYEMSGGGVTLGGGEPLMQPEAAENLLAACKQMGVNTAIETSGYARRDVVLRAAKFTDLFLFDLKHMDSDRHFELTGVRNETILENLKELLHGRYNVRVRMPLLKNVNDGDEDIKKVIQFLTPYRDYKNFKGVNLLPYHKLGVNKYKQLDMEYQIGNDASLSDADIERMENQFKSCGFSAVAIRH